MGFAAAAGSLFAACSPPPEPEKPFYYFRFEADGEAFDYKYECEKGLFGGGCTFGASATGSATHHHFNIYGSSWANKGAQGRITFYLNETDVMELDTIMLREGGNSVSINKLKLSKYDASNYGLRNPLGGKLIILERTDSTIKGAFEFDVYKHYNNPSGSSWITDTVMHVRNGSFYVPAIFD